MCGHMSAAADTSNVYFVSQITYTFIFVTFILGYKVYIIKKKSRTLSHHPDNSSDM